MGEAPIRIRVNPHKVDRMRWTARVVRRAAGFKLHKTLRWTPRRYWALIRARLVSNASEGGKAMAVNLKLIAAAERSNLLGDLADALDREIQLVWALDLAIYGDLALRSNDNADRGALLHLVAVHREHLEAIRASVGEARTRQSQTG